jgi:hypothetical protein
VPAIVGRVRVRPVTLLLCALALAAGTAAAVVLLTRGPAPPPVTAIEISGDRATPAPTAVATFAPPRDDDPDDDDPFDDDGD